MLSHQHEVSSSNCPGLRPQLCLDTLHRRTVWSQQFLPAQSGDRIAAGGVFLPHVCVLPRALEGKHDFIKNC